MDSDRSLIARSPVGRLGTAAMVVVPTLFLAYFFLYPVISITVRGLTPNGVFDPNVFLDVLTDPTLQGVAAFTLWQAVLSTLLTVIAGLPAAWVFARFDFRGKSLMRAATLVPFVLPTLVVGTAFLALIGPKGAAGVDLTGTLWIILIAHVFYNYAIVVRGVGAYWERIDPALEDAARSLGASRLQTFRTVTLPLLRPAIASTSALVFLFSFTSFGVVLLLGDINHSTIEVEIWRQTTAYLRLDVASTLAVLQLIGVGVILMMYGRYQQRTAIQFAHRAIKPPRPSSRSDRLAVGAILTTTGLLLGRRGRRPGQLHKSLQTAESERRVRGTFRSDRELTQFCHGRLGDRTGCRSHGKRGALVLPKARFQDVRSARDASAWYIGRHDRIRILCRTRLSHRYSNLRDTHSDSPCTCRNTVRGPHSQPLNGQRSAPTARGRSDPRGNTDEGLVDDRPENRVTLDRRRCGVCVPHLNG